MYQSDQINELATALSKAQAEMGAAMKDNYNPFFKSKYADLSSIWTACKEPLTKNGLSVIQTMSFQEGQTMLLTTLAHTSGQWIRSTLPVLPVKNDPQGLGSAITYLRRYSLAAITGVATEDDDGEAASKGDKAKSGTKAGSIVAMPISAAQVSELQAMLNQCDKEYQKNFYQYLTSKIEGFKEISQIPVEMYEAIKNSLQKKISSNLTNVNEA